MVDQRLGDGREDGEQDRGPLLMHHRQRPTRLEVGHREEGGTGVHRTDPGQDRAHVEHRKRIPEAVVALELEALASGDDAVADQLLVGHRAALGSGRGPRGVGHQRGRAQRHLAPQHLDTERVDRLGACVERLTVHETVAATAAEQDGRSQERCAVEG